MIKTFKKAFSYILCGVFICILFKNNFGVCAIKDEDIINQEIVKIEQTSNIVMFDDYYQIYHQKVKSYNGEEEKNYGLRRVKLKYLKGADVCPEVKAALKKSANNKFAQAQYTQIGHAICKHGNIALNPRRLRGKFVQIYKKAIDNVPAGSSKERIDSVNEEAWKYAKDIIDNPESFYCINIIYDEYNDINVRMLEVWSADPSVDRNATALRFYTEAIEGSDIVAGTFRGVIERVDKARCEYELAIQLKESEEKKEEKILEKKKFKPKKYKVCELEASCENTRFDKLEIEDIESNKCELTIQNQYIKFAKLSREKKRHSHFKAVEEKKKHFDEIKDTTTEKTVCDTGNILKLNGGLRYKILSTEKKEVEVVAYYPSIIKGRNKNNGNLKIPETIEYKGEVYTVVKIGEMAFSTSNLNKIILPKSIKTISSRAFLENEYIEEVDFSQCVALEEISDYSFYKCSKLKNVDLKSCKKLKVIKKCAFFKSGIKSIDLNSCINLESIDYAAFLGCKNLQTVSLENCSKIITIGYLSFYECELLKSVNIEKCNSLKIIEFYAFGECNNLERFDFLNCINLEIIDIGAFEKCKLLEVDLSACKNIKTIENNAFLFCNSMRKLILNKCFKLITIGDSAFKNCSNLEEIDLNGLKKLEVIGNDAFLHCAKIKKADLGNCNRLENLGNKVFCFCVNLRYLNLEGCTSLVHINNDILQLCENLEEINFSGCCKLEEVETIFEMNDSNKQYESLLEEKIGKYYLFTSKMKKIIIDGKESLGVYLTVANLIANSKQLILLEKKSSCDNTELLISALNIKKSEAMDKMSKLESIKNKFIDKYKVEKNDEQKEKIMKYIDNYNIEEKLYNLIIRNIDQTLSLV